MIGTDEHWRLKLHALLHDPPHKPLALGRAHADQGTAVAAHLAGDISDADRRAIEAADHLASGADRESWLKDLRVDPRTELQIINPLEGRPILVPGTATGRALELVFSPELVDEVEGRVRAVSEPFAAIGDLRLRYCAFWRFAADVLRQLEARAERHEERFSLGVLWDLLPADTRIPDHAIPGHDSLVAALAPICRRGEEAALLRFGLGPVQGFIENARKLRDLWAGSSILAETAWQAMSVVVEAFGPDAVIFPGLWAEPRFDRWLLAGLHEAMSGDRPLDDPLHDVIEKTHSRLRRSLRIPSLPNVFTAVVPRSEAERIAREAAERARQYWLEEVVRAVSEAGSGPAFEERARAQADALLETSWAVTPWPLVGQLDSAALERPARRWHRPRPLAQAALEGAARVAAVFGGYRPNGGLLYADAFEQAGLLVDAAKRDRGPRAREEPGLKCSICGEREVLGEGDFWRQREQGYEARADKARLDRERREQLCGVCTWKRVFRPPALSEQDRGGGEQSPSTGEIAASAFKRDVIRQCAKDPGGPLAERVRAVVEAARAVREVLEPADVRAFRVQAVDLAVRCAPGELAETLDEFARLDGQWLLPFPREDDAGPHPTGLLQAAAALRKAAKCSKIEPPRPYLGVVVFDGDEMGKWVSGTHERFPRLRDVLHSKVVRTVASEAGATPLDGRRALVPSFHGTLSAAAAMFARYTAPLTLEGEGLCGHLAYAGGDDVLFLAPVSEALELVWRLRRRFSGWPWPFGDDADDGAERPVTPWIGVGLGDTGLPRPAHRSGQVDRLGFAFGSRATASAGLAVFHYKWPLGGALELARGAERRAKQAGRDALGITIQRRSGSITQAIVPFGGIVPGQEGVPTWRVGESAMQRFVDLVSMIAAGRVSPRLASVFRQEVERLPLGPADPAESDRTWEMAMALARRVVSRRDLEVGAEHRERVTQLMLALGHAARGRSPERRGILDWAETLTAAAFVAREGDR